METNKGDISKCKGDNDRMIIPCKDCLLISLCRNKPLRNFVLECSLVRKYIDEVDVCDYKIRDQVVLRHRQELSDIFKPTTWYVDCDGYITSIPHKDGPYKSWI